MKKQSLLISTAILFSIFIVGCATIATGTKQLISINCNVEGATIKLDGKIIGKTPFNGEVKKNRKILTIEKKGYKTHTITLSKSLEGMFWGNIITGGTLGSITDFATGAAYQYSPSSYQIELYKEGVSLNEFKELYELRKFAMVNMSNISIDLSNNSGSYLDGIIYLSKLNNDAASKDVIRNILIKSDGDQVYFGEMMVELFNNAKS